MDNYLVINGVTYVLTKLPLGDVSHCPLCAFYKQCEEMYEFPFCEVFGFVDSNTNNVFVKVL